MSIVNTVMQTGILECKLNLDINMPGNVPKW